LYEKHTERRRFIAPIGKVSSDKPQPFEIVVKCKNPAPAFLFFTTKAYEAF
jgi:hypothetical protein